uniref:Rieske domain-containing protein n=1 Tax=Calcidiscus leptoporus TaxID=127549 RepID=A0A7S0J4N9_9EUKA|mmetsp:Transcript_37672/g.88098  ORF Transcript_37672/g.88098 Transcript_37672/m.88098 type:complete len:293 (+) Transcript_37672:31-909(+)
MGRGRAKQAAAHRGVVVGPRLLLGSQRTPADANFMSRHHCSHALCVARELPWPVQGAHREGVRYHRIPLDEPMGDTAAIEGLSRAIEWGFAAHEAGGIVLVFCKRGQSRSASVVAGILMRLLQVEAAAALALLRTAQPSARPDQALRSALDRLQVEPGGRSASLEPALEASDVSPVPKGYVAIGKTVGELSALPTGLRVSIGGDRSIAIFLHCRQLYAIDADCPHQGAGLELGEIEDVPSAGPCVSCPRHGWCFELATGYCEDILDYAVRVYNVLRLPDDRLCVSVTPRAHG